MSRHLRYPTVPFPHTVTPRTRYGDTGCFSVSRVTPVNGASPVNRAFPGVVLGDSPRATPECPQGIPFPALS